MPTSFFGTSSPFVELDPTALKIASNLSDVANAATARTNLGVAGSTDVMLLSGAQAMAGAMSLGNFAISNAASLELDNGSGGWDIASRITHDQIMEFSNQANKNTLWHYRAGLTDGSVRNEIDIVAHEDSSYVNLKSLRIGYSSTLDRQEITSIGIGTQNPVSMVLNILPDNVVDAAKAASLQLFASNKAGVGSTGDGGNIDLVPGTSIGGAKGFINANLYDIKNVASTLYSNGVNLAVEVNHVAGRFGNGAIRFRAPGNGKEIDIEPDRGDINFDPNTVGGSGTIRYRGAARILCNPSGLQFNSFGGGLLDVSFENSSISNVSSFELDNGAANPMSYEFNLFNVPTFRPTTSGTDTYLDLWTRDGNGTDHAKWRIFHQSANPFGLTEIGYDRVLDTVVFQSVEALGGLLKPLLVRISPQVTANAVKAPSVTIQSSNKSGGTGDGGDIVLVPGTSAGGAEGNVNISVGALKVAGTQVVEDRKTGYTDPTGTTDRGTFATGSVTTADLAEFVKAMYEDLKAHGLIGN